MRKNIGRLIVGCVLACCLSLITRQACAVDGLQMSVLQTNAILNWRSTNTETYLVQFNTNLNLSYPWQTLTDYFSAASSGNVTYFTNFNSVTYPPLISGGTNGNTNPTNVVSSGTNTFFTTSGFYRVVRDGAYIVGLTNGAVLSGVVTLPVELGNAYGTLDALCIIETNSPVGDSIQSPPNFSPLAMQLNTTLMPNGVHYISVYSHWSDTNGGSWEANSPTISITTSNEITFENYMRNYGDIGTTVLINATSAHPSTDWILYVYDDHTNYLGYFNGHTDDGDIGVYWDYSGTPYTNSQFFSFELQTEYIDPPVPKTYKQNDPWIATGAWAMAVQHAFNNITDSETLYSELSGFAGAAGGNGGAKPSLDGDGNPYAISFQDGNEVSTWATFKTALYDPATRNLVYFGHGGPNGIGYNQGNPNISITANEIQNMLHTIPNGQTNRHAFRFVFLDGCATGAGTLPESFGIVHKENVDGIYYYYASLRYSCFVGWSQVKYIGFLAGSAPNYDHVSFIQYIQYDMTANGASISAAIAYAKAQPNLYFNNASELKIYGSPDVTLYSQNN